MNIPFSGCATALVTPMQSGAVDYPSLGALIEAQIDGGVSALVPCGTTGEAPTLSEEEKRRVIAYTVEKTDSRLPVIAGCGSPSTEYAARISANAERDGASGILVVTPYYNKASAEGLFLHYEAVAASVGVPVILYNVPSRTGMSIGMEVYERLVKIPNICGVKEASSNVAYAGEIASRFAGRLAVYSGCDELCAPIYAVGGRGLISVISNIMPEALSRLCSLCESGRLRDAAALQQKLNPLIRCLFSEVNPIPVKTALAALGKITPEMRLPLCPMGEKNREALFDEMHSLGLI